MEKLPQVTKAKQVGKNLNVVIGEENYTVTGSKEELAPIKEAIKTYQEKGIKKHYTALIKLLTPKTTKEKEVKEKEVSKVKADIKAEKNKVKAAPKKKIAKVSAPKRNLLKDLEDALGSDEVTEEDKVKMRKLLANAQGIVTPEPKEAPTRRSGEH